MTEKTEITKDEASEEKPKVDPVVSKAKPIKAVVDAVAKHVTNPEDKVLFISKDRDCNAPIMAGGVTYTPSFDDSKSFLVWKVDTKNADAFEQHTFVKFGKVVRALEK